MYSRMGFAGVAAVSVFLFLSVTATAFAGPTLLDISVAQRTDGSGMVDVYYTLANGVGNVEVAMTVSPDNGATWSITPHPLHLTGDVGEGITNGVDKHIVWDLLANQPKNKSEFMIGICGSLLAFRY
jgi:hypothetical protein